MRRPPFMSGKKMKKALAALIPIFSLLGFCMPGVSFAADALITAPPKISTTPLAANLAGPSKSFDECASEFFSPDMPAELEALGMHMKPRLLYAWLVDVTQGLIPTEFAAYDWAIGKNKPYFNEATNGWKNYNAFIEREIKPFLEQYKEQGRVQSFFINAPDFGCGAKKDEQGQQIGSLCTLSALIQITFIPRDEKGNIGEIQNKKYQLTAVATHLKSDNSLKLSDFIITGPQ